MAKTSKKAAKKATKKTPKKAQAPPVKTVYEQKCYEGREPRIEVTEEFVARNKLAIDREAALAIIKDPCVLAFDAEVASDFVTYDEVKDLLDEECRKEFDSGEKTWTVIDDVMEAVQDFLDYMVFAWMKADDERGISASRSVIKLSAWMRILGRPDVADVLMDDDNYNPYGIPALIKACEMLGIEYPAYLKDKPKCR